VFAGILALLNEYLVTNDIQHRPGLGNVNPALYLLARVTAGVFHDITVGSNIVPCQQTTLDCVDGSMGFFAGPGYDLASGLGSLDVANFLSCMGQLENASRASHPDSELPRERTTGSTPSSVDLRRLCVWVLPRGTTSSNE
jgi:hypothetical protein